MTAQDAMPEQLGDYRLLDTIGEGGMGIVFLAHGPDRRTVALKVLRSGVAEDPMARRRLAREVETMRRVRSPYVAEVIDADLQGPTPYIVTRYVPGRTLDEVVSEGGPLQGPALARLARGLAEALVAVHAAGVVHRDLKPGNVMLLEDVPVVIDFGIAQAPDATRLTLTGMFMGTPGYLSPEVIEGRPSSEASDVHAWGATVAFAATARPPFGTGPYETIFYRIVNGQPDLAGAPVAMLPLLASALARHPAHRPTAASLSTQSASLDPASLTWDVTAAMEGEGLTPSDVAQGTRADASRGTHADDAHATRADSAHGEAAAAHAPAAPGAGAVPGSTARLPGPLQVADSAAAGEWLSPADFADVLPPVDYDSEPSSGLGRGPDPATMGGGLGEPAPGGVAAGRAGWHPAMVVVAMVAAVGASVILPVVGTISVLVLIMMLRAGELTQRRRALRRVARGARAGNPFLTAVAFPWFFVRSVAASVLVAPFALALAAAVGGIVIAITPGHPLPRALAYAAGAVVAFYGLGPGSGRSRRQLSRIFAGAVKTRMAQVVALIGLTAFAVGALAAAVSWPSFYWPTAPPGGLPYLGRLHHLGMVGHLLLVHRHGM